MVTPLEKRFARLAFQRGLLTRLQLNTLVKYENEKQAAGATIRIWDSAVVTNMMDAAAAQKLRGDVGELDVEKLGDFVLDRQLGQGGMGSVWLARGPQKEKVAIKVLSSSLTGQRTFVTRFFREAEASIKLQHKNIVRGKAVGEENGVYYFAMEFIDGKSVGAMLEEDGPFDSKKAAAIMLEVAEALAYAHEKSTIHRDIKPDNIMMTSDGHAKVADLGLARVSEQGLTQLTGTGTAMGTPLYMAPEQFRDAKRADARSDIYSLGATWYHMLTGSPPFTGQTPLAVAQKHERDPLRWEQDIRSRLPKGVCLTIERMMTKNPNLRPQTMDEVATAIKKECLGERDIFKELGIEKEIKKKPDWLIKVERDGEIKELRIKEDRLRPLIQQGKIATDTLLHRAGAPDDYKPLDEIPELATYLPPTLRGKTLRMPEQTRSEKTIDKTKKPPKRKQKTGKRQTYHDLATNYDEFERQVRRKKKLKKLLASFRKALIYLLVLGVIAAGLVFGWPYIGPHVNAFIEKHFQSETTEEPPPPAP